MGENTRCFGSLVVAVFFCMGCLCHPTSAGAGVKMPAFSLSSATKGEVVDSKNFAGKAMLVTFFATWCAPCRMEIPVLKKVHAAYAPQGFTVIGISVDESGAGAVVPLIEQEQIPYPVLLADSATVKKFGGVPAIPTSFLINKKGEVVKTYPGYIPTSLLEKDINSVL